MPFSRKPSRRSDAERNALAQQWLNLVPWALFHLKPTLRRLARRYGSRDLVQDGNIRLLRAAELWDEHLGKFPTYATECIRKGALHTFEKKRPRFEDVPIPEIAEKATPEPLDLAGAFDGCLSTLTCFEREVIKLRYGIGHDCSYTLEEVGRIFKVTREHVRQFQIRAEMKLRQAERTSAVAAAMGWVMCRCGVWCEWQARCKMCKESGCEHCLSFFRASPLACPKCRDKLIEEAGETELEKKAVKRRQQQIAELEAWRLRWAL